MGKKKGLTAAVLTLVLTSLLCLALYRFDNKYIRQEAQPISGVLFYESDSLTYLTRQWICYPDVLLTPETVDSYAGYRIYADIGGETEAGTGSVTYRLTVLLPDEIQEYALELPEVFSACRLYVNDRLHLQLGEPEPEHYQEGLSSRIVTFSAAGQAELLLAVSDYSGVKLGLSYPPAFGPVNAVLSAREGRMFLHGSLVLLALLGALLALVFGMQAHPRRGALTCLLCLSLAVVTGYPLYHSAFITAVQPWYTLEPTCYYGLLLCALLLQCSLYELRAKQRWLLSTPCVLGMLATAVCFGGAAVLPAEAIRVFSLLSTGLKYYTACCLLLLSLWALRRGKCHSVLLLSGSSAFAACLLWDRFLPLYEPIYGGWFGEIGGGLLALSLAAALWLDAADAYRFRLTYEASIQQLEQRLALQKEHYKQLSGQVRLAREASHDLRHHVRAMRTMTEQQQWERLIAYLTDYESHLWEREVRVWSDHPVADAVLAYYAASAKQIGASYDVRFAVPAELPFPDDELCILLSNLLENAVDALTEQQAGPRRLYLRGQAVDGHLGIVVDNTYSGKLLEKDGVYLSTKHHGHGFGLNSVITIAEKHGGLADFSADSGVFHASVFLPLPARDKIMNAPGGKKPFAEALEI